MTDPEPNVLIDASRSWHRIMTRMGAVAVLAASFLPIIVVQIDSDTEYSISIWKAVTADDRSIWVWLSCTCVAATILSLEYVEHFHVAIPWHFVRPAVASGGIAWTFLTWLDIDQNYMQEVTEPHGDVLITISASVWLILLALWLLAGIQAHKTDNAQQGAYLMLAVAAVCSLMNLIGLAFHMRLWMAGPDQLALPIRIAWGTPILQLGTVVMIRGLIGTYRALPRIPDAD